MAEQSTDQTTFALAAANLKTKRGEQVGQNVVVIAGVQRDVHSAGIGHRAYDVQRLIAVERRNLDRHHVLNFREPSPEGIWQ